MSVVKYKCDTCNREVEITQNKYGLESFGRCNITDGCKGRLKFEEVLPTFLVGGLPSDVEGLNNWTQRKLLYKHEQTFKRKEWVIKHNLSTEPSIQTHVYFGENLIEVSPLQIITVDKNTSKVIFEQAYKGIAQCISRSTNVSKPVSVSDVQPVTDTLFQVSNADTLIFASKTDLSSSNVRIHWIDSNSNYLGYVDQAVYSNSIILSWGDYTEILYKGISYTIYNLSIVPPIDADEGSSLYFTTDSTNIMYPNGIPFDLNESILLLTNLPFSKFDIVKNKIHDMSNLDSTTALLYSSYESGEVLIAESRIKTIYPALKTL